MEIVSEQRQLAVARRRQHETVEELGEAVHSRHARGKSRREAPLSGLPAPALRCRSGRSSFGKPSNWLSVRCADLSSPPSRGEIGCRAGFRQSPALREMRRHSSCQSPPLRGRCPAGQRGGP
ncbi:MAG: hypothetical protein EOS42_13715 [Mesorhizobium sp.]|nr:MAG: hypothetical protein EOS42_13715 [Mesorhizobium sp.]